MKVLLLGYYGSRNLGDDMMMACLLDCLRAQGGEVTVVSENPEETRTRFGVRAVPNTPLTGQWDFPLNWKQGVPIRLIREIWKTEALVVGGGDLIRDDLEWGIYFYTVEKILLALLLGRPVYLLNVGLPRPRTWYGKWLLRLILSRSRALIVRDQRSWDLCREYGASRHCFLVPDIVAHLPEIVYGTRPVFPLPSQSGTLVVCLRGQPNTYGRYVLDAVRIQGLAVLLDHCIESHGLRVEFLPFQQGDEWGDGLLHRQVASVMKRADRAVVRDWTGDFREVMNCLGSARLVLAMRLHAAVLSVALERPCILMPYDQKLDELGRQFGLTGDIGSAELEAPENLAARLDEYLASIDQRVTRRYAGQWKNTIFNNFVPT